MKKKYLIVVHWNEKEARELAEPLKKEGWRIVLEYGKGGMKMSEIKANPPAAVVISLRRFPSHGREVADALWYTKWGREIPILFFDGEKEKVKELKKKFGEARFVSYEKLIKELENI